MKHWMILCISMTSCAPKDSHIHALVIGTDFQSYFADFEKDAIQYGHPPVDDLVIQFSDTMPNNWAGECKNGDKTRTPQININTLYWNTMVNDQKQDLIYHEMGHCVLNREHKTSIWNGMPDSIMWPSVLQPGQFQSFKSHYVTELFTGKP